MKKPIIPIFFSVDDNYIPLLSVALTSMIENSSKRFFYQIHILHSGTISSVNQNRLTSAYDGNNIAIEFVDISKNVEKINEKLHTRDYYSKSTYYRLFIPNLYPMYDKILYLDSDIVICGDISELYNVDLKDNLVGAITDGAILKVKPFQEYVENRVGVKHYEHYFNAGILLMNNKKLREINFEELFIDLLTMVKFNVAQDQDYLNAICRGKVTYIENAWNQMPINYIDYEKGKPNLIHYNLSFKPWHKDNIPYGEHFWKYAQKSPYYKEIKKIKSEYTMELQEISDAETIELMKKATEQALAFEENVIINNAIAKVRAQMK